MDLFSSLLNGKDGSGGMGALGALLPLLLGGKGGDLGKLLEVFGNNNPLASLGSTKEETAYPPLFGGKSSPADLISALLNNANSPKSDKIERKSDAPAYPYELQYNRPEPKQK